MNYRPLRPYFFKPVAILGVPLRDWYITIGSTITIAIVLFFFRWQVLRLPLWLILSVAFMLFSASFFIWVHNTKRAGYLEYTIKFYSRELLGIGQTLHATLPGRKKTNWLIGYKSDEQNKIEWLHKL